MAKLDWFTASKSLSHRIDQALTLPAGEQGDSDEWEEDMNDDFENFDDQDNNNV